MTYALIVMLWTGSHGVSVHHVTMASVEVCEIARMHVLTVHDSAQIWSARRDVKAFCVRTQ